MKLVERVTNIHRKWGWILGLIWLTTLGPAWAEDATAPEAGATAPPTFDLLEIRVVGNSVLDNRTIEKTVYPFLGPGKGIAEIDSARQALEAVYHERGYQTVFVNIPEQDVENGLVRLEVAEGKIDRLKITGSRYYSLGRIRERVPELAEGKVPHTPTLEKEITRLSEESKDRRVTPMLRAGTTPGTVEAELKVDDELPVHGSVEMNGRNSVGTSRTRLTASLRYDNLWQRHHSASLQYQTAPEEQDVEVWAGTYVMPLFDNGMRLALYGVGVDSTSEVASAGALSVVGTGHIFGMRLIKPFENLGDYSHSLSAGLDYKSFDQAIFQQGADTGNSPLSYLPFMVRYDGGWKVQGSSVTSIGLETRFSVRGLGNDQQEFEDRRFKSRPDFIYFVGELKHQHVLPGDLRLAARVSGQVADSPLISNEQFAAGGDDTVRGYHEVQELGDHGVIGSLELHSPNMNYWESVDNLRGLMFVDAARLWIEDALPGTPERSSLASAGLGLRMEIWKHLSGVFDWAYPLVSAGTVGQGEQRVHFKVAYEF
ncbi:ShlB/FhaC/HecB family hemolysin secretion/activation protein [Methylococcus sp. EFPC2]|uniref:ShlB/FhaC/HecB family hemolysin secretion/activation protein n=1 Tax=Methylococcus sp. EFPC2 TaxID=2812648 RepID=UPI001967F16D|nr:POTRA domain-containing protein [Methylococcus sp. EFPC2]QSA97269.1 ShlB/FhaC/HecB family hemolysin secretion/activation protein [Methylococcus sp. EFPC2]